MAKAELFNIEDKKRNQRESEMAMSPSERLLLCLDLMDLYPTLRQQIQPPLQQPDEIQWIELFRK